MQRSPEGSSRFKHIPPIPSPQLPPELRVDSDTPQDITPAVLPISLTRIMGGGEGGKHTPSLNHLSPRDLLLRLHTLKSYCPKTKKTRAEIPSILE